MKAYIRLCTLLAAGSALALGARGQTQPPPAPAATAATTAAATTRPIADPQPSGPLDIPVPLWILVGTCATLGTAGLTVSWHQKRKKLQQRRVIAFESM
jgi:hypothetical protein